MQFSFLQVGQQGQVPNTGRKGVILSGKEKEAHLSFMELRMIIAVYCTERDWKCLFYHLWCQENIDEIITISNETVTY